jgi:hypothetical protein
MRHTSKPPRLKVHPRSHVGRWLGFVAWMVYTKASGLATDSRITKMDCAKMALVV